MKQKLKSSNNKSKEIYQKEKEHYAALGAFIFLTRLLLGEALFSEEFKAKYRLPLMFNSLFTILLVGLLVIPEREQILKKLLFHK